MINIELIKNIIHTNYGMRVVETTKLLTGAGSDTYTLLTGCGKYILKNANISEMNNPQNEPALCGHLRSKGLPVSEFIRSINGNFITACNGKHYHLQKFVEGKSYKWNSAPDWLLRESAQMLGKIHAALDDYAPLPVGIGEDFFKYMTPMAALASYEESYQHAMRINDRQSVEEIAFRIELMKRFSVPEIRLNKITCKNTHGDFCINQLICGDEKINAVIDWTTACIHPVVWEIMRSYVYAAPECQSGDIDIAGFLRYVKDYLLFSKLTISDLKMMPYVFYYQIAVCDYYKQYYQSTADNRELFLGQAQLSTKLMRWFDKNAAGFSEFLINSSANSAK